MTQLPSPSTRDVDRTTALVPADGRAGERAGELDGELDGAESFQTRLTVER